MSRTSASHLVGWHEAECGRYEADLPAWRELAAETAGPALELGCGTGRVAAVLAADGREVIGVDVEEILLERLPAGVDGVHADALSLALDREFGLVAAPMSLANLLGAAALPALLETVARHLGPYGLGAVSLLDPAALEPALWPRGSDLVEAPDEAEVDGIAYTSTPHTATLERDRITVVGERRASAAGRILATERVEVVLELIEPGEFEARAAAAGLKTTRWIEVPATYEHVASLVAVVEHREAVR